MRTRLFKGFEKQKSGKEIIYLNGERITGRWVDGSIFSAWINDDLCDVIPDTISQFTGRYDSSQIRIWENDIVKASDNNGSFTAKVEWQEQYARFGFAGTSFGLEDFADFEMEVIRNQWNVPRKGGN